MMVHNCYAAPQIRCREALSARGADPLLDGAVHGVAPTHCQRLVFGTAALTGPCRAVAIGADGQSAAGIAEPERHDAVVGLLATIGQPPHSPPRRGRDSRRTSHRPWSTA